MNADLKTLRPLGLALALAALVALGGGCGGRDSHEPAPAARPAVADAAATRDAALREHALTHARGYVCPMHPDVTSDAPAKCPICGMDLVPVAAPSPPPAPAHAAGTAVGNGATVQLAPGMQQSLGVRTAAAEAGAFARRVDAVATVAYDARGTREVRVRADGWVEALEVRAAGERVRAGQVLFRLYSPKLASTRRDLERARSLDDAALVTAAEARLRALGASAGAGDRVAYRAPVDGVVAELNVYEGSMVSPDSVAARITPLGRIWIVASVPESQSAGVSAGVPVRLAFPSLAGTTLDAKVAEVLPELDGATRTVQARIALENPDVQLRPGMVGTASFELEVAESVVHVPTEAVLRTGRDARVVLALGDGRFASRTVVPGLESGDRTAIRSGLAAGEVVVVSGQFLIDSESSVRTSLGRMAGEPVADPHAGHGAGGPSR